MKELRPFLVLAALIGVLVLLWVSRPAGPAYGVRANAERSSMFHAPKGGCPPGTTAVPDMFNRDGKPVPGCQNPKGDGTIDILYPGESVAVTVGGGR